MTLRVILRVTLSVIWMLNTEMAISNHQEKWKEVNNGREKRTHSQHNFKSNAESTKDNLSDDCGEKRMSDTHDKWDSHDTQHTSE